MYAFAIVLEDSLFELTTSSTFSGPPPANAVVAALKIANHTSKQTNWRKKHLRQRVIAALSTNSTTGGKRRIKTASQNADGWFGCTPKEFRGQLARTTRPVIPRAGGNLGT